MPLQKAAYMSSPVRGTAYENLTMDSTWKTKPRMQSLLDSDASRVHCKRDATHVFGKHFEACESASCPVSSRESRLTL